MDEVKKHLILFPQDSSTLFLEEIILYFHKSVHNSLFHFVKIEPNEQAHLSAIELIKNPAYKTIIFLGHGTHNSLHGASEGQYKNDKFITTANSEFFQTKNLIFISCESSSFLKKIRKVGYLTAIGFGDLPTDWNDIQSAREADSSAYIGFSEKNIELFKKSLVEIIKYSFSEFFINDLTMKELHDLLLLRINKRIMKYYLEDKVSNAPLNDALLRMKYDLILIHN